MLGFEVLLLSNDFTWKMYKLPCSFDIMAKYTIFIIQILYLFLKKQYLINVSYV